MLQTIILLLCQAFGIYFTVKHLDTLPVKLKFTLKEITNTIYIAGILMPLLEESLFRSVCKQYLTGVQYSNIINGIIFGLAHIQNYIIHKNKLICLFQVISTSYLGYYLVQYESFMNAFMVHCMYNIIIMSSSYGLYYYKHRNDKNLDGMLSMDDIINSLRYPIRSVDDGLELHWNDYKYINKNKINKELLISIEKFDDIKKKSREKFNKINLTDV